MPRSVTVEAVSEAHRSIWTPGCTRWRSRTPILRAWKTRNWPLPRSSKRWSRRCRLTLRLPLEPGRDRRWSPRSAIGQAVRRWGGRHDARPAAGSPRDVIRSWRSGCRQRRRDLACQPTRHASPMRKGDRDPPSRLAVSFRSSPLHGDCLRLHFELLRAFADDGLLASASADLVGCRYRAHEFGDSMLLNRQPTALSARTFSLRPMIVEHSCTCFWGFIPTTADAL